MLDDERLCWLLYCRTTVIQNANKVMTLISMYDIVICDMICIVVPYFVLLYHIIMILLYDNMFKSVVLVAMIADNTNMYVCMSRTSAGW